MRHTRAPAKCRHAPVPALRSAPSVYNRSLDEIHRAQAQRRDAALQMHPASQEAKNVGLVLEGGGMRAAYTGGVLDAFLDEGVRLPYVIGVSAGANAGSDYVASQRERNHRVFVELAADPRYAGFANLLRERSWFGMRFLFETLPDELAPFHYDEFRRAAQTLVVAVTDCATGRPVYYRQHDYDGRWFVRTVQRASSSLPVLSPPVMIEGRRCLDGGVSDPLPLDRSIADGNLRNVVVLTRNAGYRKEQQPSWLGPLAALALPRYPLLRRAMRERHLKYNSSLDRLAALEQAGQAFVLRPLRPLVVDRLERDVAALDALYRQGYKETLGRMAELKAWLDAAA
jgi:predicted patatin/cPLA2 family phospholipase